MSSSFNIGEFKAKHGQKILKNCKNLDFFFLGGGGALLGSAAHE